jgi:hypothetical protein
MNLSRQIGTELAAALSDYPWPGSTTLAAVFRRIPDYTLEDLGTLKCSVIPGPVTVEAMQLGRGADLFKVTVGIVLAKHVGDETEIQQLEDLNQAIIDAIRSERISVASVPNGTDWIEITLPVTYDRDALTERSVFMSQIEITYQVPLDKVPAPA